ncbi:MAG: hypothetical protein RQ729_06505 [Wenzhouxiangellaceae bacterium]|nr:hypothetical protein [Wenzhouxiangellaceae bacterium]
MTGATGNTPPGPSGATCKYESFVLESNHIVSWRIARMYELPQGRIERFWLIALRLAWVGRLPGARDPSRLIDRLMYQSGLPPLAHRMQALLAALESGGANHLYIESFDAPGVTGDERDILTALCAVYRDDLLGAEEAISALVPPDGTAAVIGPLQAISRPHRCRTGPAAIRLPSGQLPAFSNS